MTHTTVIYIFYRRGKNNALDTPLEATQQDSVSNIWDGIPSEPAYITFVFRSIKIPEARQRCTLDGIMIKLKSLYIM